MTDIKSKEIILIDINKIIPNPKNTNKHSKDQITRLKKLIEYNGFRDPLIISNRSGFLICGHGRLKAAEELKMEKIPVIYQDFESEAEEFQFMTAHNAIAKWAELDNDLILSGVDEFKLDDLDLLGIADFKLPEIIDSYEDKNAEIDTDDFGNDLEHTCPKCGFEFNE